MLLFHFWSAPLLSQSSSSTNGSRSLEPGESYSALCWFRLPNETEKWVVNFRIGYVFEYVVDGDDRCNESDEGNNHGVVRWWFPYATDPPFTYGNFSDGAGVMVSSGSGVFVGDVEGGGCVDASWFSSFFGDRFRSCFPALLS